MSGFAIAPAILTLGSLTVLDYANASPLYGSVSVPATSSNTSAGTVSSSPVVYQAGDYLLSTNFTPVGAGTSNISLGTPGGFSTPTPASTQQITATVTAPPISVQTSSITTGNKLAVSTYAFLSQTPTIAPAILNSGVLTVLGYASLNPGLGTVTVPVGSTSPQIGTVSPTSIPYGADDYLKSTTFHPLATGTTDVVIVSQPSGFTTPSQPTTQQIVVTVQ